MSEETVLAGAQGDTEAASTETTESTDSETTVLGEEQKTSESTEETSTEKSEQTEKTTESQKESTEDKVEETQYGAPESYADFTIQEGAEVADNVLSGLNEVARDMDLSQEQAQKLLNLQILAQQEQQKFMTEQNEKWIQEINDSPDYGGKKLDENKKLAALAKDRFIAIPGFKELLNEPGVGNRLPMFAVMVELGKSLSDDSLVTGSSKEPKKDRPLSEIMYDGTK